MSAIDVSVELCQPELAPSVTSRLGQVQSRFQRSSIYLVAILVSSTRKTNWYLLSLVNLYSTKKLKCLP